jgi:hypothetical protein
MRNWFLITKSRKSVGFVTNCSIIKRRKNDRVNVSGGQQLKSDSIINNKKALLAPELLAPAGRMPQLMAAVQAGADAVYLGGRLFNARMNAGNFDDEERKEKS